MGLTGLTHECTKISGLAGLSAIRFTIRILLVVAQITAKPFLMKAQGVFREVCLTMPMNLIFVCHCHFRGNSAMHLCSIARVLTNLGHSCAICVPERAETILDHGRLQF